VATLAHWEVTLLRWPLGAGRPRVAGRLVLEARDAAAAKHAAEQALAEHRDDDRARWSLGVLRPLSPRAPGTRLYRVTFAVWESQEDRFVRRDVHILEIWAEDAGTARRLAHQEIQSVEGYLPAWRIRQVIRSSGPKRRRRRP